jgi:integrase
MANKRPNGEGSISYVESKELYRAMLVTPAGKCITKSSKNEDVVKDWLNEQRMLIGRNLHVEPSSITLQEWLISWLETYSKPGIRQRTYERYNSLIDHFKPIANLPIQKITPDHLQTLYNSMREEGYSGETCKKVHQLVHKALRRAQINRYIQLTPPI